MDATACVDISTTTQLADYQTPEQLQIVSGTGEGKAFPWGGS